VSERKYWLRAAPDGLSAVPPEEQRRIEGGSVTASVQQVISNIVQMISNIQAEAHARAQAIVRNF
jgi:hypothetical protein